jgi:hypothetical protein
MALVAAPGCWRPLGALAPSSRASSRPAASAVGAAASRAPQPGGGFCVHVAQRDPTPGGPGPGWRPGRSSKLVLLNLSFRAKRLPPDTLVAAPRAGSWGVRSEVLAGGACFCCARLLSGPCQTLWHSK